MPDRKSREKKQIEIKKKKSPCQNVNKTRVVRHELLTIEPVISLLLMLLLFYTVVVVVRSTGNVNRAKT